MLVLLKRFPLLLVLLLSSLPVFATETIDEDVLDNRAQEEQMEAGPVAVKDRPPQQPAKRDVEETFKEPSAQPFLLIGEMVAPGKSKSLRWNSPQSPGGVPIPLPVIVVNGSKPGPVLCLTAAIHGDELNGIEIIRRVMLDLDPKKLKGVIVGVPIVNLEGFWRKERYIGDRRDLNRYFPGNAEGSYPERVAHALFTEIIQPCDMVIDLHTGSFFRENLPQLRVDLTVESVAQIARSFGAITALQSIAPAGSLRGAATKAGVPTVVMEVGGPLSLETDKVVVGVKAIQTFLESLGMISKITLWPSSQPVFYRSKWIRADSGGILISKVGLGTAVKKGEVLGEISNPLTDSTFTVLSPMNGTVIGKAQNQFVSPGFGIFHMGVEPDVDPLEENEGTEKKDKQAVTK